MSDLIFIQRARIGIRIFRVRGDRIEVAAQQLLAPGKEPLLLRTIQAEPVMRTGRLAGLYLPPMVVAGVAAAIGVAILLEPHLPSSLACHPLLVAGLSLIGVIRGILPIQLYVFLNHWGRPVFYLAREFDQAEECDTFRRELSRRIVLAYEQRTAEHAEREAPGLSARLPAGPDGSLPFHAEIRCWIALTLGLLAITLPLFPNTGGIGDSLFEAIAYIGPLGGACFAVLSWLRHEPLRWIGVLGGALALAAPYFYRWNIG